MNNRWSTIITAGLIAALLVGAAALGGVLARPTAIQAAQAGGGVVRQITVVGTGETKAAPDQATVQIGVQSQAATSREALTDNTTKMEALIARIKELGVDAKDIQTSGFGVSPTYSDNGQTITGYQVNNTVSVTIRAIDQAGELLDQVVSAGANTVYGISFGIGDPKALESTARDAAIADAQIRAEAMAKAAGGAVGQVLSISETIGSAQPLIMRGAANEMAQADSKVPVETGEQTISAQVQITFELQ